jgi:hypothetical protein
MKVYDTASAISQIDCNDWVKLQDVESIIAKVRAEYVNPKCVWGEGECVPDCPSCKKMDEMLAERAVGDREGQRDMLNRCIVSVENLRDISFSGSSTMLAPWVVLGILRDLEVKE